MTIETEPFIDPRSVLALGPGADEGEVRLAYRRLVKRYHPDISGDPSTAGNFANVTKAYKVLIALPLSTLPGAGASNRYRSVIEAGEDLFALGQILASDPDEGARCEAAKRLGLSGRTAGYVFLRKALYDSDELVAAQAVRSVALLGAMQAEGELASLYGRASSKLRRLILEVAEATLEPVFKGTLVAALSDPDSSLREHARRIQLRG